MTKRTYGTTESGRVIDDDLIEELAAEAEAGYDVDLIISGRGRGRRGRPRLGAEPSIVVSVRLDPDLDAQLASRAQDDGVPVSEVIRRALRQHLEAG